MKTRRKIVLQGVAAAAVTTIGLIAIAGSLPTKTGRPVALEHRPTAVELEPMVASKGPGARPRSRPTATVDEPTEHPAAAAEPKNGDEPAGLLEGVAAKMLDNAIATFWSVVNALIVGVTMRRYSKAGKEAKP